MNLLNKIIPQTKKFGLGPPLAPFRTSAQLASVDLTGNLVKLVHAKNLSGKWVVQGVASKKWAEAADSEASAFLAGYFKERNITAETVLCVLPSKWFISKNVDIPSTDREEISKIIDLQAGRFTPYSRDEIVIDFLCMETPTQYYTSVLLIIVNRKLIERYCRIFEDAFLPLGKIVIASESMAMFYNDLAGRQRDESAVGGIHIAEDASDLTILDKRQMVFVRSLPVGMEHFKLNQAAARADFVGELNKSLAAYQNQGVGRPIKFLVLTGLMEGLDFLEDAVKTSSPLLQNAETQVKAVDYRNQFSIAEEAVTQLHSESQLSFFEVLTSLSFQHATQIDLVPREIKLKKRFREGSREIITLGVWIMTFFLVFSLFLATKIYFKSTMIRKLEEIDRSSFEQARSLERISTKNRVVRRLLENRGKGLYIFDRVSGLVGEDMYMSRFQFDSNGKITIAGTAESMSRVFAFVTQLEESNYFSRVKTKETKSRREGKQDVADFELQCVLAEGI